LPVFGKKKPITAIYNKPRFVVSLNFIQQIRSNDDRRQRGAPDRNDFGRRQYFVKRDEPVGMFELHGSG
jgi:hypothetical protein